MHASTSSARPRRIAVVTAGLLLFAAACQAMLGVFGGAPEHRFPHAAHAGEALDCTSCHAGAEDGAEAGMPASVNGCMLCHEELDANKPLAKTVASFVVDGKPVWLAPGEDHGDVRFDHSAHARAEIECAQCHTGTIEGKGGDRLIRGGKARCLECHAKTERGAEDCSVCHTTLRRDAAPPDHAMDWQHAHGRESRTLIPGLGETTCAQCHEEVTCLRCHREEKPDSHTNFWRRRGHGLTASIDRQSCATCHNTDECVRCHQSAEPVSHRGAWGPPGNRHCSGCHLPATANQGCGVCHLQYPAHPPGTSLPPSPAHTTAVSPLQCLACHVTLSHANPGGDCRSCHR